MLLLVNFKRNKVASQLTKWRANFLSHADRTVLIQAYLATKASFQMQNFALPPAILYLLDKSDRDFLWNKDPSYKAPNLIGWDKFASPKNLEGWG